MTRKNYLKTFLKKIQKQRPPAEWLLVLLEQWHLTDAMITQLVKIIIQAVQSSKTGRYTKKEEQRVQFLRELQKKEEGEKKEEDLDALLKNM